MSELEKYTNLIIDKIKKNKISTTEVADCLNKSGNIPLVKPINKGHFRVGKIYLVYGYDESNWTIHEQLQEAEQDSIILVETYNLKERAVFGSLVSKYLLLYKGVSAIVVNGNMRDGGTLIKENYPIWCKNLTPIGSFNKMHEASLDSKIVNKWKYKYEGAIAVCDGFIALILKNGILLMWFAYKNIEI